MDTSVQQQGEQTVPVIVQTSHFGGTTDALGGFNHRPVLGRERTVPVCECLQSGCFLSLGSVVSPIETTVNRDKNSSVTTEREK